MINIIDNIVSKITGQRKYWTHWQWYKSFFSGTTFKFFVSFISLLPIIAKVFQSSPQENSMVVVETQLKNLFDWELLWLAAIFYLVAYALYSLLCPKLIKTYNNFKDYKSYLHSPRWLVWLAEDVLKDKNELPKFIDRLETKEYLIKTIQKSEQVKPQIDVLDQQTILSFNYSGSHHEFGMPILNNEGDFDKDATEIAEQEIFWELFGRYSSNKKYVRLIISAFLWFSIILFGIVILQYMISMFKYIFV